MNTTARQALRAKLVAERRALPAADQRSAALAVAESVAAVVSTVSAGSPGVVAGYIAHRGEISPALGLDRLRSAGWQLVLPVCGIGGHMEFCPWTPGEPLKENRYGIGEPVSNPVGLCDIDVVIVPGVGFDRSGNRIGHGVGFYDRFFDRCAQQLHHPYRLGVAYEFQIVDLPEPEPWDIPVQTVVSPVEVIDTTPCE